MGHEGPRDADGKMPMRKKNGHAENVNLSAAC